MHNIRQQTSVIFHATWTAASLDAGLEEIKNQEAQKCLPFTAVGNGNIEITPRSNLNNSDRRL